MLFDDFLKPRVVQLCELCQIMHVGDDIAQISLKKQEFFVRGPLGGAARTRSRDIQAADDMVHFSLTSFDALNDFVALQALEGSDFVELAFQQGNEASLIGFCPRFAIGLGIGRAGIGDILGFEGLFQTFVVDIMPKIVLDHGRAELLTEPVYS